jgi:hypothetical protein
MYGDVVVVAVVVDEEGFWAAGALEIGVFLRF